jgi:hypothetical protein
MLIAIQVANVPECIVEHLSSRLLGIGQSPAMGSVRLKTEKVSDSITHLGKYARFGVPLLV